MTLPDHHSTPSRKGPRRGMASSRGGTTNSALSYTKIIVMIGLMGGTFYAGLSMGRHATSNNEYCNRIRHGLREGATKEEDKSEILSESDNARVEELVRMRVKEARSKFKNPPSNDDAPKPRFSEGMRQFAVGMAKTTKRDFLDVFDYGQASLNSNSKGGEEVLIIFQGRGALPSDKDRAKAAEFNDGNGIPMLGARDATANCDVLNVVTTNPKPRQCLAIMNNYESYHLQRWMRIKEGSALNPSLPLQHVGRGMQDNGINQFYPPKSSHIQANWEKLKLFLNTVDNLHAKLKPIAERIARNNTIVVMVCNLGQSSLLINFVCAANARGIDVSNVLVFATDEETLEIAEGLGLAAFYDEQHFGSTPTQEAHVYGDGTFQSMMYVKVLSVQLINFLGYDLLFQDVDMIWYKDPLSFFHSKTSPTKDFHILFQDDGARSVRYAPYAANTGFYYVRHNDKTRYLLTSLLYSGDMVLQSRSHQQAMAALLAEHSSLYGLKVKTMRGVDFPGGFHYHREKELMRDIATQKTIPYIFHMSWTHNKENKVLFFRQMGMWYLKDQCVDHNALEMLKRDGKKQSVEDYKLACCSAEPIVSCHYRDKPSVIPCNQSPNIDKRGKPFWPDGVTG